MRAGLFKSLEREGLFSRTHPALFVLNTTPSLIPEKCGEEPEALKARGYALNKGEFRNKVYGVVLFSSPR